MVISLPLLIDRRLAEAAPGFRGITIDLRRTARGSRQHPDRPTAKQSASSCFRLARACSTWHRPRCRCFAARARRMSQLRPGRDGPPWNQQPGVQLLGKRPHDRAPSPPNRPPARVSRMMEGNLIYKVQPVYPHGQGARIQGSVVLRAIISKSGQSKICSCHGPPMLVKAAREAVSQWRYRPYSERPTGRSRNPDHRDFMLSGG